VIPKSSNSKAMTAYVCAVYGLIPVAGLLLGPAALVLGILGLRNHKENSDDVLGLGHARAAVIFGTAELVANAIGLTLIAIGLASLSS
jgi:hypothetical protein